MHDIGRQDMGEFDGGAAVPRQLSSEQISRSVFLRFVALAVAGIAVALGSAARAEPLRPAEKVIALIEGGQCDWPAVELKLDRLAATLSADPRARKVVVDRPLYGSGLDPFGQKSPFTAALEVLAAAPDLDRIIGEVQASLSGTCRVEAYKVHEQIMRTYERDWPVGEPSPGGKLISTVVRKQGLAREAFYTHWAGPHAAIALANPVKTWRYVQNAVVARTPGSEPDVDGIVEMHYRNPDALKTRMQVAPQETKRGIDDAHSFMDLDKGRSIMTREVILRRHDWGHPEGRRPTLRK